MACCVCYGKAEQTAIGNCVVEAGRCTGLTKHDAKCGPTSRKIHLILEDRPGRAKFPRRDGELLERA